MSPQANTIDPLLSFSNVHTLSIHVLLSLFKRPNLKSNTSNVTLATISPAYTTTQLLVHTTSPTANFISAKEMLNLSTIPEPSIGSHLSLLKSSFKEQVKEKQTMDEKTPLPSPAPLAALQKRPTWSQSHAYVRGVRSNSSMLRILVAEANMIRASKITGPLKPRKPYIPKREDEFVWGAPSKLRLSL
jgi:hypothetical protein